MGRIYHRNFILCFIFAIVLYQKGYIYSELSLSENDNFNIINNARLTDKD